MQGMQDPPQSLSAPLPPLPGDPLTDAHALPCPGRSPSLASIAWTVLLPEAVRLSPTQTPLWGPLAPASPQIVTHPPGVPQPRACLCPHLQPPPVCGVRCERVNEGQWYCVHV